MWEILTNDERKSRAFLNRGNKLSIWPKYVYFAGVLHIKDTRSLKSVGVRTPGHPQLPEPLTVKNYEKCGELNIVQSNPYLHQHCSKLMVFAVYWSLLLTTDHSTFKTALLSFVTTSKLPVLNDTRRCHSPLCTYFTLFGTREQFVTFMPMFISFSPQHSEFLWHLVWLRTTRDVPSWKVSHPTAEIVQQKISLELVII